MINIDVIEKEILDLEKKDTTYAVIERLSWLYTVRDHIRTEQKSNETTGDLYGSEFCQACSNVPVPQLMEILSEHMEVIMAVYPKEYAAIIQKIKDLG